MKILQVNNYTNQYLSNRTQQASSNPNFGKVIDVKNVHGSGIVEVLGQAGRTLEDTFGFSLKLPNESRRIVGFEKPKDIEAIQAHFDEMASKLPDALRKELKLVVERRPDGVVGASVSGAARRYGNAMKVDSNPVIAAKNAITGAIDDLLGSARADKRYDAREGHVPEFYGLNDIAEKLK